MVESRTILFTGAKYTLMVSYGLNIIIYIIFIVWGTFVVSSAHMDDTTLDLEKKISHDEQKVIKKTGYLMVMLAAIGIGISWMGIYAVYKEIYKLNLYLSVFGMIGLVLTLITQTNPVPIVTHAILTGCSIYYTMKLKYFKEYAMEDNPELGKIRPTESSAIAMESNQP